MRDLILNHLQSLKESLEEQGIQVGEFEVDVQQGLEQQAHDLDRDAGRSEPSPSAPDFRTLDTESAPQAQLVSARLQLIDLVA